MVGDESCSRQARPEVLRVDYKLMKTSAQAVRPTQQAWPRPEHATSGAGWHRWGEGFEVVSDPFLEAGEHCGQRQNEKRRWSPRTTAARDSASERGWVIAERSLRIRLLIHHRVLIIAGAIGNARQISGTSTTQHVVDC